jgi:hypothetical protein
MSPTMHENEKNNLAYIAFRYGHSIEMDEKLWNKVKMDLSTDPTLEDIIKSASEHAWLLKGRPNKTQYQYDKRISYATDVANHFMKVFSEDERKELGKVAEEVASKNTRVAAATPSKNPMLN